MGNQITDPHEIHRLLDERILTGVQMPGRYVGGELNTVRKDPADVEVSFALLFPDTYEVGMSHLGYQILYGLLNGLEWAAAERAYAVWPDMERAMRDHGIPLYALESFRPVRRFDVVGFSLQYELLHNDVLAMLDLAGIPLRSAERGPDYPLVIAGGPCASCPEPLAEFLDLVLPGDGEEIIVEFARFLRRARAEGMDREQIVLEAARQIDGAYAPAHYEMAYREDGTVRHVRPTAAGLPERVHASKVPELELTEFPTDLIVPFVETVHDRITLEIMRGCTRGCRFCQAGMLRRPVRARSPERLRELAQAAYRSTGHKEISLASLSSSDHPQFATLLEQVNEFAEPRQVGLSLSSLRVSDQLTLVPQVLSQVRKSGLTIAPEAASERLRRVINKDVSEQELLEGAREAFRQGWRHVKLYFMVGLPTETEEDVAAIVDLSEKVSRQRKEVGSGPGRVNVSIAPFVPKPHTPFQWEPMADLERLRAARRLILDKARMRSVRYDFHDPEASLVEAALARGDRRLGAVLERVWRDGGRLQNWSEHFVFDRWLDAFAAEGLSLDFYATRERAEDEVLPWEHIDFGLTREFLLRERAKARRGELTPDCRTAACSECGACDLIGMQPRRL